MEVISDMDVGDLAHEDNCTHGGCNYYRNRKYASEVVSGKASVTQQKLPLLTTWHELEWRDRFQRTDPEGRGQCYISVDFGPSRIVFGFKREYYHRIKVETRTVTSFISTDERFVTYLEEYLREQGVEMRRTYTGLAHDIRPQREIWSLLHYELVDVFLTMGDFRLQLPIASFACLYEMFYYMLANTESMRAHAHVEIFAYENLLKSSARFVQFRSANDFLWDMPQYVQRKMRKYAARSDKFTCGSVTTVCMQCTCKRCGIVRSGRLGKGAWSNTAQAALRRLRAASGNMLNGYE